MPFYLAMGKHATVVRTKRGEEKRYSMQAGDVIEVARDDIAELVRAGAPVDWDRPLSTSEANAAKAKREAAEAEKAAREAAGKRFLNQWIEAWGGPRCPGSPGATIHNGDKPHDAPADPLDDTGRSGLHVHWRDEPTHVDGGWYVAACYLHAPAWQRHELPPPQPPTVDKQVRQYRVTRRFGAVLGDGHNLTRDPATRLLVHDGTGRVRWHEGDIVQLPGWLAAQVERDSPGTLQLLGADGQPVAPPAPSTEDTATTVEAGNAKPRKTVRARS